MAQQLGFSTPDHEWSGFGPNDITVELNTTGLGTVSAVSWSIDEHGGQLEIIATVVNKSPLPPLVVGTKVWIRLTAVNEYGHGATMTFPDAIFEGAGGGISIDDISLEERYCFSFGGGMGGITQPRWERLDPQEED